MPEPHLLLQTREMEFVLKDLISALLIILSHTLMETRIRQDRQVLSVAARAEVIREHLTTGVLVEHQQTTQLDYSK